MLCGVIVKMENQISILQTMVFNFAKPKSWQPYFLEQNIIRPNMLIRSFSIWVVPNINGNLNKSNEEFLGTQFEFKNPLGRFFRRCLKDFFYYCGAVYIEYIDIISCILHYLAHCKNCEWIKNVEHTKNIMHQIQSSCHENTVGEI